MILIITEKPSMAKKYREALKDIRDIKVVNSVGHIETLEDIDFYLKDKLPEKHYWSDTIRHMPFVPEKFQHHIKDQEVFDQITAAMKNADEIILACDPDREGELIHRNILEIADKQGFVKTLKITRMWLNSETAAEIQKAFKDRKSYKAYEGYYDAARTRESIDWLVGIQLTRLYSVKYGKPGKPVTIGRVQSWLLAEITQRYLDNKNHASQPFWTYSFKTVDGVTFNFVDEDWKQRRLMIADNATAGALKALQGNPLLIGTVETKPFTEYAPALFDLKALQKAAANKFKFTPDDTLKIAQSLYETHELISYPRTDCSVLSVSEAAEIGNSVELINRFPEYKELVAKVKAANNKFGLNKKYIGELQGHYAIIPVLNYTKTTLPQLKESEAKLFDLIVKQLLAALLPPATGNNTTQKATFGDFPFLARFKNYTEMGYKGLLSDVDKNAAADGDDPEDKPLKVSYEQGQQVIGKLEEKQDKTKPEPLYNDAGILTLMERAHLKITDTGLRTALKDANGIGTAATRASFIPTLTNRGYIIKEKNCYIPTELGISLTAILPDELKIPDFSARLEHNLWGMIQQKGETSFGTVVTHAHNLLKSVFAKIHGTHAHLDVDTADAIGKCPKCGHSILEKEKGYFCSDRACGMAFWKTYATAKLTMTELKNILKTGTTKKALKMKSKEGKDFEARLALNKETWKLEFKFEDKSAEKPAAASKPTAKKTETKKPVASPTPSNSSQLTSPQLTEQGAPRPLSEKQLNIINHHAPEAVIKAVADGDYDAGRKFLDEYFKK